MVLRCSPLVHLVAFCTSYGEKSLLFIQNCFIFVCVFAPSGSYNITNVLPSAPDIAQFKQGVKSVAGKLSVLANGVMTSIQVSKKYLTFQLKLSCRHLMS